METWRSKCLNEALRITAVDRNKAYGDPEDNFSNIADVWNAQGFRIDGRQITSTDVALAMVGMKLARLRFNANHRDSWVDMAGYAACGMETAFKVPGVPLALVPNEVTKSGWVSDNRCGEALAPWQETRVGEKPHEPHRYGRDFGQWCDGYV